MRTFDPELLNAIASAVEAFVAVPLDGHPLGCHRPPSQDRACFEVMLVRLATGCYWEDAERLTGGVVSDTTARDRPDQWIAAGIFDAVADEALAAYDKVTACHPRTTALRRLWGTP
jgi:transposase